MENKKKPRSLRYIDTDFRWADSRGIRFNHFYVIANYVISVVTCIHFKWSSAGPRRGLRNNREVRYIGLRYIDSWLYPLIRTHVQGNEGAKLATENFKMSRATVLRGDNPCFGSTAEKFIIVRMMLCITHRNLDLACCITFVLHQPLSLYIFPCNCHSSLAFHRLSIALKYFLIIGFRCHIGDDDYGCLAPCSETYVMSQASSPTAGQPTPAPAMAAALIGCIEPLDARANLDFLQNLREDACQRDSAIIRCFLWVGFPGLEERVKVTNFEFIW